MQIKESSRILRGLHFTLLREHKYWYRARCTRVPWQCASLHEPFRSKTHWEGNRSYELHLQQGFQRNAVCICSPNQRIDRKWVRLICWSRLIPSWISNGKSIPKESGPLRSSSFPRGCKMPRWGGIGSYYARQHPSQNWCRLLFQVHTWLCSRARQRWNRQNMRCSNSCG